jgi:hypothetical protein
MRKTSSAPQKEAARARHIRRLSKRAAAERKIRIKRRERIKQF